MFCETVPLHPHVHGSGSRVVPAVDPLVPQDVQARGEDHTQVHPYTEQDEGDRH
jgi:hypothetical protein